MQSCGKLNELLKLIATFECKKAVYYLVGIDIVEKGYKDYYLRLV